ncbi:MAG: type III-A CRISPR-associated RAMP protein Csm3 [Anaerolineae bacterium]|nr:type III-A CRISPR-associated RAMP protein Csm3 [Anaerolineae bacterium]
MTTQWKFLGKYILQGKIHCQTGLHIGGNTEGFEIGGMDNPVVVNPLNDQPYIPGSSLKGKLRHLLEWNLGKIEKKNPDKENETYGPHFCGKCEACRIFGPANNEADVREMAGPTRLSVRDSFLTSKSVTELPQWLGEGIFTEAKTENAIDRVTAVANPRPIERVPAGAEFDFTVIFDVYREEDRALLKHLFTAMAMLEDSALGGGGSRGHGVIAFKELKAEWRSVEYYRNGTSAKPVSVIEKKAMKQIVSDFKVEDWKV